MTQHRAFRKDMAALPIGGGYGVVKVQNKTVNASEWTTIKVEANCKAILAKLRSGNPWKARVVGGADHITIDEALSIDIALLAQENLFQVQTASGSDTFELMLLD